MIDMSVIKKSDPELYAAMDAELKRQRGNLELIASETVSYTHLRAHETDS